MAKKRMAWETAHYLGIVTESDTETIHLLGVGVKSLNRSPAPQTTTNAYINDRNASPTVTGYQNSFTVNYDDIVDDEAVKALQAVADEQKVGADAEFYYYRVDLLDGEEAGGYKAVRYRVTCEPGDETNEASQIVSATCVLRQVGDLTKGTMALSPEVKFTPDAE
ncbi:MAG: hypothetical protein SOV75_07680 [Candidatus Limiplasma sp.]|nr:hypothetical protein [Candidatus Limiplasma sp.]